MNLSLRYYGDPILRQIAEPVQEITDEVRALVKGMIEVMKRHDGIGLAAPQVGHLVRIFVSNVDHEDQKGELHLGEPIVYINPELSNPSEVLVERSEGCISIPKLYLPIVRPLTIHVKAQDLEGQWFEKNCYGYHARNIMHENDHLNGVLHIDRIKGKRRTMIEPELRRIRQKYGKRGS